MKILFLDHPQLTAGSYCLWHGLNEILPPWGVLVYPHLPTHYDADTLSFTECDWYKDLSEAAHKGALPYGIPPFHPGETLLGGDQKNTRRDEMSKRFPPPEKLPTEKSVVEALNAREFDLIVLANSHRVPTILLGRLKERASSLPPIVYYDAGERDELNEHWVHVFRPALVFKQILTPKILADGLRTKIPGYTLNMFALPLSSSLVEREEKIINGVPFGRLRVEDGADYKNLDIVYSMGLTWEGREGVLRALDTVCRQHGLPHESRKVRTDQYHASLAQTRMAVSTRGSGRDTTRYWEIPLYETLMIADGTMGAIHPFPFTDGKNAAFYHSLESLCGKVLRYASRTSSTEDERRAIAGQGKLHLWRYHSTAARAVVFLDRIEKALGIADGISRSAVAEWKERHGWEREYREGCVEGIG